MGDALQGLPAVREATPGCRVRSGWNSLQFLSWLWHYHLLFLGRRGSQWREASLAMNSQLHKRPPRMGREARSAGEGLDHMSANSHAPVLPGPQSVTTVGDMAQRGAVKVDEVTGWALVQCSWCPCEKRRAGRRHAQEGPCGDVGRGRPPTCQGARPPENQPRPTP